MRREEGEDQHKYQGTRGTTDDRQMVAPECGAHIQTAPVWKLRRAGAGLSQGCRGQGGPENALAISELLKN